LFMLVLIMSPLVFAAALVALMWGISKFID
jgi:hypothetical protein